MYVITGATGQIGHQLVQILIEAGEKLMVIARTAERLQPLAAKGAAALTVLERAWRAKPDDARIAAGYGRALLRAERHARKARKASRPSPSSCAAATSSQRNAKRVSMRKRQSSCSSARSSQRVGTE